MGASEPERVKYAGQGPRRRCRKRGQKQKDQIQVQRTFDRRTGELNASLGIRFAFLGVLAIPFIRQFAGQNASIMVPEESCH